MEGIFRFPLTKGPTGFILKTMLRKVSHFVKYNNAFPVLLMILFGGVTTTFAASETAREAIYNAETQTVSVDNTFLLETNIDEFAFGAKIVKIEEDDENYYVAYQYHMIEVLDFVWQDVLKDATMTVSKRSVVGKDLGSYVASQLGELVQGKVALLKETQNIERSKGETSRQVATLYSGLVGRMLSPSLETFEGYSAVIAEYQPPEEGHEELAAYLQQYGSLEEAERAMAELVAVKEKAKEEPTLAVADPEAPAGEEPPPTETPVELPPVEGSPAALGESSDTERPVITRIGPENIELIQGESWIDPGATVSDNVDQNLGVRVTGDGFDRSELGYFTIRYDATDSAGNRAAQQTRLVHVVREATSSGSGSGETGSGGGGSSSGGSAATTTPPVVEPTPPAESSTSTSTPPAPPAETGTTTPQL